MADDMALMWAEVADIGTLLHELDEGDFDTPSLCEGWRVRDVLGHMALGHTTPMGQMTGRIARYGFNVTKASREESKTRFDGASAAEIRQFWDEVMVGQHPRKGISKLIPSKAGFLDHLVHNQDIRRPTGHTRTVPADRLRRALELVRSEASPMFNPKKKVSGLRLVATDLEWSAGDGPVVEGPAEAIVMAAAGRAAAVGDLHGEGAAILAQRIGT
jgi:uncharacterized protein (TIGR03083 family)